jgi:hypothetical protein
LISKKEKNWPKMLPKRLSQVIGHTEPNKAGKNGSPHAH